MVYVKIELWPHGDRSKARGLGEIFISNDLTGDKEIGNYQVRVGHGGRYFGKKGFWRTGRLQNFRRNLSPYHLVAKALRACRIG